MIHVLYSHSLRADDYHFLSSPREAKELKARFQEKFILLQQYIAFSIGFPAS